MDRILKPGKLEIDPNEASATRQWKHWQRIFTSYVNKFINDSTSEDIEGDKLSALVCCSSPEVYQYFDHCLTFTEAEKILEGLYVKQPNEIFARHLLRVSKQKNNQTLEDFRSTLVKLAKDCNFKDVTAGQYREEMIRDSFINGLHSPEIRQRLLEHKHLTMAEAFQQAVTLQDAKNDNRAFSAYEVSSMSDAVNAMDISNHQQPPCSSNPEEITNQVEHTVSAAVSAGKTCRWCGNNKPHEFKNCKARSQVCFKCGEKGHYGRACHLQKKAFSKIQSNRSSWQNKTRNLNRTAALEEEAFMLCAAEPMIMKEHEPVKVVVSVNIQGQSYQALLDTGSSKNFIHHGLARRFQTKSVGEVFKVAMAQSTRNCMVSIKCSLNVFLYGVEYESVELHVMNDLCVDIILGRDFLGVHRRVIFEFKGKMSDLIISNPSATCAVAIANVKAPSLFLNLKAGWKPVATKSRRFSWADKKYISSVVDEWKLAGTVRPSNSPWRAQCVVVKQQGKPSRLAIDYSQTINLYTEKDGFPIPLIEEIVNELSSYKYFASYDLKRAYHQVPIPEKDKQFTAFEAAGELLEFNVIPFGVTNGGPVFQRFMRNIIQGDQLRNTLVYFDNIIVGGQTLEELQKDAERFQLSMKKRGMTLNDSKTIFGVEKVNILGYCVSKGEIKPDPERLEPLLNLPPPSSKKSLQRALGLFAYYSKWIPQFSDCIGRLKNPSGFPLNQSELKDFESLKQKIASAALKTIDESKPFTVECDASAIAIAATLNQEGRPVAFMSRSFNRSELLYPAVEKEATAIIEAIRKWEHLLMRQHFTVITDQRSVAFMFDSRRRSKIKNNKIMGWRLDLASFSYTIRYRPGPKNVGPDTLSRAFCAALTNSECKLKILHQELCCPGVARLWHYVRQKNLPYSLDDVRRCCKECKTCSQIKPQFFKPEKDTLIKATQPMERLNLDFKGPLPSTSRNRYFLCIIDEFSRYPFCFPCSHISAGVVISCLDTLFSLFGTCNFIHSDRGSAFMSNQLKDYLLEKGIASSRTTPYHPEGNGQCERYNGIIWKAVKCATRSRGLSLEKWETVLPEALNSIRSLLCTATNATPHSRFFSFPRRSSQGRSLPGWLRQPGPVLLRKFVRSGKNDDIVRPVHLIDANPMYARIRHTDGRESTVSLRDLAPNGATNNSTIPPEVSPQPVGEEGNSKVANDQGEVEKEGYPEGEQVQEKDSCTSDSGKDGAIGGEISQRCSSRANKGIPPARFGEWI